MRHSPFTYGSPAPNRMRSKLLLFVVIGVMVLFSILVTFLSNDTESTQLEPTLRPEVIADIPTEAPAPTATTTPTIEPSIVLAELSNDVTYQAIQEAFRTLSKDEWTAYARSLVDHHILWQGQLLAVHTSEELWFVMDASIPGEIPQTALHLIEPNQSLTPGSLAVFEGDIARIVVFNQQILVHVENGQLVAIRN